MLSYLVLAAAILAVVFVFSWRESRDSRTREEASLTASQQTTIVQEYERRLERALAVVNLAAVTPATVKQIADQGTVEFGPAGQTTPGTPNAVARLLDPASPTLQSMGIGQGSGGSVTGAFLLDGRPQAIAVTPVSTDRGLAGYILTSVDLTDLMATSGRETVFFTMIAPDGSYASVWPAGAALPAIISRGDVERLAAGTPISVTRAGGGSPDLIFHPLPGPQSWPQAVVAVKNTVAGTTAAQVDPLLGIAVLTFTIGLFVAHFLARTVSRPVERITEATERVAAGDLSFQLPEQKGNDELSVLGDSFNRMTQKYNVSRSEVEAAAVRLEETVIAQDAEIQTLFGISRTITSVLDINYLLEQVLSLSLPLLGSEKGVVWLEGGRAPDAFPGAGEKRPDLEPAISLGGPASATAASLPADHAIISSRNEDGWAVSVLLPESAPERGDSGRQLFFTSGSEGAGLPPIRHKEGAYAAELLLPDGLNDASHTQVVVPIAGQKGFPGSILCLTVPGRRPLSEHEALLIFNIAGLASVAVDNAGLYGLAQRRGEQIETLLRESQHRITNNLAAISGMLAVQLTRAEALDTASVIRDNINRISSIAQVHRLLAGEMKDEVDAVQMIRSVCGPSVTTATADIELQVEGQSLILPAKLATPLALISNELVINSVKHGFQGREKGKIVILIESDGRSLTLDYRDDGNGPDQEKIEEPTGLGMRIIGSLVVDELLGSYNMLPGPGYHMRIKFPLPRPSGTPDE